MLELLALLASAMLLALPIAVAWLLVRVGRLERELARLQAHRGPDADHPGAAGDAATLATTLRRERGFAPDPGQAPTGDASPERSASALAEWVESAGEPPAERAGTEAGPARPRIDWERWLGVRGAGVLGGVFAALAAVLLFRHAIQEGWITAGMRVGLGLAAGLVLGGAGQWLRPRGYRYVPDALLGAGAVAHYASLWAAAQLYGLIPPWLAFALMALVTAAACGLALRHGSVLVALIALVGGFATPLLLSTGEDRPWGLFGYLLLLDLGLLLTGRRLASGWISAGALVGTALLQGLWIGAHHGPGREGFTLAMLAVFALLFLLHPFGVRGRRDPGALSLSALLLPFLFALYVARHGGLEVQLAPLLGFATILLVAACALGARGGGARLATGAVAASLALLLGWRLGRPLTAGEGWAFYLGAQLLALVPHAFLLLRARRAPDASAPLAAREVDLPAAASLAVVGLGAAFCVSALSPAAAPFAALTSGVALLWIQALARTGLGLGAGSLSAVGLLAGAALAAQLVFQSTRHAPSATLAAICLIALASLGHLGARALRDARMRRAALLAAGLFPLLALGLHAGLEPLGQLVAPLRLVTVGALALSALVAARGRNDALLLGGALLAGALALALPNHAIPEAAREAVSRPWGALARLLILGLVLGAAFALAPIWGRRNAPSKSTVWLCGLAPLAFALALQRPMDGMGWYRGEPWLPAAFFLVAWPLATRVGKHVAEARSAHGSAAIVLGALALARGLHFVPDLVAAGLVAGGAVLLWRRTAHPLVKWLAVGAALAAAGLCAAHFGVPGYYPRGGTVLLNGLALAHATAAAGASLAAALLARDEAARLTAREQRAFSGRALGAPLAGLAAALLWFLWLTLTVMELWSDGPRVAFPEPRAASFDLTLSLSWAAYGLALLALGLVRGQPGPRWVSLAVLLLVIGKVFLRDLGDLEGLARVGSLAGLALSLTLVSLLYQRFVFGRAARGAG